jgi:hypothetical protein
MKIVIPDCIIQHNPVPQMVENAPVYWARVQYMGGEIRVQNPKKFDGTAKDVEIEIRLQAAGKTFRDKATQTVSGGISQEAKFLGILSAKIAAK